MTLLEYIDKYGNFSFKEKSFNEVDNIILSSISYLDLSSFVPHNMLSKISLQDTSILYFKWLKDDKNKITAHKSALKVFKCICKKKRYKNLMLYNYKYIKGEKEQFKALTIDIDDKTSYISFEGTDDLISGWKEDFYLACFYPVESQKASIHYANKFILSKRKLIFGGHSKGGNLALTAACFSSRFVKDNIIAVYSNDGPGFRKKEFESDEYKEILPKYHLIIPNYSFFGLLLRHTDDYEVVKSSIKGIYAHDFLSWQVDDDKFKKTSLSKTSIFFSKSMKKWVESYNDNDRLLFVNSMFEVFDKLNIKSVEEILKHKTLIPKIIIDTKPSSKVRRMQKDFIKIALEYLTLK